MTILFVTGGAGFIGSNFIRYWLSAYPDDRIVNYDLLTYAGNLASLQDVEENYGDRYTFVRGDIQNADLTRHLFEVHRPDYVVNFAAESHNSLAIVNPSAFFQTNVVGTQKLLQAAADAQVPRFHHISTCEVYGDLALDADESFTEESPYRPRTSVQRGQGCRRLGRARLWPHLWPARDAVELRQQFRPLSIPGESHSLLRRPLAHRPEDAAVQIEPEPPRMAPR